MLLISDVLGDVGQSPQSLPKSDRPAGEKRGQGSPDKEDREPLPEGGSPYHGEDHPYVRYGEGRLVEPILEKKHRVSQGHALLSDRVHPEIACVRRWSVPPIAPWP